MRIHRRKLMTQLSSGAVVAALLGRGPASSEEVSYTYDALGRLTGVTYSGGGNITYTYDAAGNRTQVSQTSGAGAPSGTFAASPASVAPGSSSTLSWTSASAVSASVDSGVGAVTPVAGGSVSVSPSATTTYTLTLTGPGGQATKQATVTVTGSPPTGTFAASPALLSPGGSSTLSWTSANATSASIDNGVGSVTPASGGSIQVSPSAATTYTLTLTGPGGQTTKQATVTVIAGTLSANPASISTGGASTLSWTSSGATSASIDNGVGPVTPVSGGSVQVSPGANTTYTLTLSGPGGQITRQAAVTVSGGFNATIPITGSGPVNLRSLANAAGYNGAENATITFQLANSVTITGSAGAPNGGIAIDTGTWPSSQYSIALTLQVSGKAYGGGGRGNGGAGGDAIYCRENMAITVSSGGQIKGGGGGGGQGGGWQTSIKDTETGQWGPYEDAAFGGGGGGGFPNGPGGTSYGPGGNGAAGTTSVGGAGGSAGAFGTGRTTGAGGAGGGAAAAGPSGTSSTGTEGCGAFICRQITSPSGGGQPGYAIRKNGKIVSATNNGTIVGTQA